MKISYNYLPLMQEINEEVEDGVLHPDDMIQIVRAVYDILGYRPIIDWYYGKKEIFLLQALSYAQGSREARLPCAG